MRLGSRKPLMRNLGEFFGHIVRAVRTDPRRKVISKTIEERTQDNVILRRTTIDELEVRPSDESS